jgi:hypothetical protein
MFILPSLISLNQKLLAYDFQAESGLSTTGRQTGHTTGYLPFSLTSWSGRIVATALGLMGVVFLGLIIYAGVLWLIAEGDEAKVEKARKILFQATIGLIIILAAYAISFFVISALAPK